MKPKSWSLYFTFIFPLLTVCRWIETCIEEPIPPIVELEETLRDGVTLAKLVRVFAPELVPRIFEAPRLQFRHSDNISRFFQFVKQVELPEVIGTSFDLFLAKY